MSALQGWFESCIGEIPSELILDSMSSTARELARGKRAFVQSGGDAAMAAESLAEEGDLVSNDAVWTGIIGRPRWVRPELALLASAEGHAAALRQAYRQHGLDLFTSLRGSFALAVIDRDARRALLAIDRFGVHTMCYSQPRSGGIVFGSTTDAVRAHPAVGASVREQAIFDYLYFGICPSPGTIYREQFKLLPAQYAVYQDNAVRKAFYWSMPYRETTSKSVELLSAELIERLRVGVARAIAGRETATLGAFLSGGLDSSTIVGLLSEATGQRAKAFTIGFPHDEYDEGHYAEIAARHFGIEHHYYPLSPRDVVNILTPLSRAFDEPFGNSSAVPTYYCAKMAKEHGVKLMLAGDGGDEIFAGNSRYVDQRVFALYDRIPWALRAYLIEPVVFGLPGFDRWALGRKARGYIRRAKIPMPERLETYNFYGNTPLREVFTSDILSAIDPSEPTANLREVYERAASSAMLQRMLHLDLKITLADNDLRKVGRACDIIGMPVAYPFLDDDVAEFSAQIPASLLIRRFSRRWFFKRAMRQILPPETLAKPKHGFGMPYEEWPRKDRELREIVIEYLASFRQRHYLHPDFLNRVIKGDETGAYSEQVWDIVMLELWFRERKDAAHDVRWSRIMA
jgi:asparagine synthase (glutamine-hydrolysing)